MNDYLIELESKNAFRDIPQKKMDAILKGVKSYSIQDKIQAVVMAISEGYKLGYKKGVEDEQVKRNINRIKRKQS